MQLIDNTIRYYEICSVQQCLDPLQMLLLFINILHDPPRQFLPANCSPHTEYTCIIEIMRRHYNSEARKLQLQSDVEDLELNSFMRKQQITDECKGLSMIINRIKALAPQLLRVFQYDHHKTRYLRHAVLAYS